MTGGTAVFTVSGAEVEASGLEGFVLPVRVQEALGELLVSAKEGLLALGVEVALEVLGRLLEEEVEELVGPKGKWNRDRGAVRHGHERGSVTLGGRRVPVARPRVRSADGERELPLVSYEHFADRDPLRGVVMEQLLAGVSTRRFKGTREPVGSQITGGERSVSKSAVSRTFISRTREALIDLMSRSLSDMRLAALMIDGIDFHGRCCVVALGIATDGVKIPLGLWDGSTENAAVATELLVNLRERGLDPAQPMLCVIDGAKALRKALRAVLGEVLVQRCIFHKERNVLDHLPKYQREPVQDRLRFAWDCQDYKHAKRELDELAAWLERRYPGAAASLREGLRETLTVQKLGITGPLKRTLHSTNPCESMIRVVRDTSHNVTNWQNGEMILRWTAAGMLQAERQFQRITGHRQLADLAIALEHHHPQPLPSPIPA
jgi:transposase-like protein